MATVLETTRTGVDALEKLTFSLQHTAIGDSALGALVAHADMRELIDTLGHLTDAAERIAESLSSIAMNGLHVETGI